jgi:hypothetical protein
MCPAPFRQENTKPMATTTINTAPLDQLIGQLGSLEEIDFEPLMLDLRAILERDNVEGAMAGLDGWGEPLEPVTYRPKPNKVKPTNFRVLVNNNLSRSSYRELDGPPLAPRREQSRIVTNFRTAHLRDDAQHAWVAISGWEDVLSLDGVPFLGAHFHGEGNLPVRNLAHVRPSAWARAKEALHDFAVKLVSQIRGR